MKIFRTVMVSLALAFAATGTAHAQTIVGAWSFGDTTTDDSGVLIFLNNGIYFHIEDTTAASGPTGFDGYERGTYSWSGVNGTSLTFNTLTDTNGDIGASSIYSGATLSITGNSFVIGNPDGLGGTSDPLTRVTGGGAIVGAWYDGTPTSSLSTNVIVFLPNNTYFLVTDMSGHQGIERGTYNWNSLTQAFSSSTLLDTNGTFGLSDPPFITSAAVAGGILTLTDSVGPSNLNSISAVPEPSTYAALAGVAALGLAAWHRRRRAAA